MSARMTILAVVLLLLGIGSAAAACGDAITTFESIITSDVETGNLTVNVWMPEKMGLPYNVNQNPIALHVDDVAESRAKLEGKGVSFMGDIVDTGVCHMAFFADPDGNALMLHHRYAPK